MRIEIQVLFSSLISSPSASFPLKIWELKVPEITNTVAVTGESLSHSSPSAKVINSFAHKMGVRKWDENTNDMVFVNLISSYVIYGQTNGLQSYWDRQGIKH